MNNLYHDLKNQFYLFFSKAIEKLSEKRTRIISYTLFFALGMASFIWFLIRVIPKPSRATYPCVKATAPWASAFVIYMAGLATSAFSLKKFRYHFRLSNYTIAVLFLAGAVLSAFLAIPFNENKALSGVTEIQADPNQPIGVAKGIFPGRVVWVHDPEATDENCTNTTGDYWFQNTDTEVVESMLSRGVKQLAGKNNIGQAWQDIFVYFNETHGKGSVGYQPGEKIYIKINLTTSCCGNWQADDPYRKNAYIDRMDATPELCLALLRQLVNNAGVAQSDIYLGDPFRRFHNLYWDMLHTEFPDVHYMDGNGLEGREQTTLTAEAILIFSDGQNHARIPQEYVNAAYFINMPCLKTHNEGGITLTAKNHQGSIIEDGDAADNQSAQYMHYSLPKNSTGYGKYRHTVDYLSHEHLGGKTLLNIVDGIWAGRNWEAIVEKWQMAPFNNDYPSSLFLSQDPVALESVCYDFLLEEYKNKPSNHKYPYYSGTDDFLYQAADPAYWPAGITYDPEDDGTPIQSLGVYEHWNDPVNKQYSRNLKTGNGIELLLVSGDQIITSSQITTENSDLPSNKVNTIYVDSANVKWIGTDNGLARYNDTAWTIYSKNNHLLNNNVKDIAYERTKYGTELWMATDSGLSVAAYNVDGITSATTYHRGNSGMVSNMVSEVAVDINHNRWIATDTGIVIFRGTKWDSVFLLKDVDHNEFAVSDYPVTDIKSYEPDSQAFISTWGKGVARIKYDPVDGFTGASAYGLPWASITSDNVSDIAVKGAVQWYATDAGANMHASNITKGDWTQYVTDSGLVSNNIIAVYVDNEDNVWFGTNSGLTVMAEGNWYSYTKADGLISNTVNHITSDMEGNVWIATPDGIEWFSSIPGLIVLKAPGLTSPANGATGIPASITMNWQTVTGATAYKLQVDDKETFDTPIQTIGNIQPIYYSLSGLDYETSYYWRIAAERGEETGPWSEIWNFTTEKFISGVNDPSEVSQHFKAYPSPVSDDLYLQGQLGQAQHLCIKMFSIGGQLMEMPVDKFESAGALSYKIDVSDREKYAPGIYIIQVSGDTFEQKIKITIQ